MLVVVAHSSLTALVIRLQLSQHADCLTTVILRQWLLFDSLAAKGTKKSVC